GTPEVGDSEPEKGCDDSQAHQESRSIERALAAKNAPAEAVDDAHHGIEAVPEAPCLRHHPARKSDGRDVQAELDDKRNEVAEISIPYVQCRDQEGRSEARQNSEYYKAG